MESSSTLIPCNFELTIYHANEECDEDWECPEELTRLLEHESRAIQPQEPIELIYIGDEVTKQEIKIGSSM